MKRSAHAPQSALSADDVRALLDTALQRPAREGARIVALHWLHTLCAARDVWTATLESHGQPSETADASVEALHKARVALRRVRATLREHEASLGLHVGKSTRQALKRLNAVTGTARDRDVQRAWLEAQHDTLPESVQHESTRLKRAVQAGADKRYARVANAFHRHLDRHGDRLAAQLSHYTLNVSVGQPHDDVPFALHLAGRVRRGVATLQRDLEHAPDISAQAVLHELRITLKQQRAMLSPFAKAHPDLGAWYAMATEGQDLLGAMRDATLLAERARDRHCAALADVILEEATAHYEAFRSQWIEASDRVLNAAVAAVDALEGLANTASPADDFAASSTAHGLPMEIERKFLLHGLPPDAAMAPSIRIEQGWLPGTVLRERLRRSTAVDGTTRYTRTIKLGRIGARIEVEEPTEPALFDALWPHTIDARIRKRRHLVRDGALTWEIDVFLDRDLVLAEVELTDTAQVVALPGWLAPFVVREVTSDPAFLNSVMARRDVATPEYDSVPSRRLPTPGQHLG